MLEEIAYTPIPNRVGPEEIGKRKPKGWQKVGNINPDFGVLRSRSKYVLNGHCENPRAHKMIFVGYVLYEPVEIKFVGQRDSVTVCQKWCPSNGPIGVKVCRSVGFL